ncbi:Universal stress protein B [Klebsiella pneumoniae]|uniref:Universal stress protein B n=1 Tax=Klebsiella pneumoniae TaxID=573 RepID=A0A2X3C3W6_KLEPN|nr:Universal stress protein B [Klebsiella pneumoniae]
MCRLCGEYGTLLLIVACIIGGATWLRSLLYQYVDGGGFFTSHGQPSKQMRLVWYIYAQRYRDHHDDEFIRRCERVRRQFILTSALCGLVVVSLIALMIWH